MYNMVEECDLVTVRVTIEGGATMDISAESTDKISEILSDLGFSLGADQTVSVNGDPASAEDAGEDGDELAVHGRPKGN